MYGGRRSKSYPTGKNSLATVIDSIVAGCIYWLPAKNKHGVDLLQLLSLEDGEINHRIVVLSVDTDRKEALVFILTSLGGKTLLEYSGNATVRRSHIPVHPGGNPDSAILLFLHGGLELPIPSYVKTKNTYILSWQHLRPYRDSASGKQYKLRTVSLHALRANAPGHAPSNRSRAQNRLQGISSMVSDSAIQRLPLNRSLSIRYPSSFDLDIERTGGRNPSFNNPALSRPPLSVLGRVTTNPQFPTLYLPRFPPPPIPNHSYSPYSSRSPLLFSNHQSSRSKSYTTPFLISEQPTSASKRWGLALMIMLILSIFAALAFLCFVETK